MGNTPSNLSTNESEDVWWNNGESVEDSKTSIPQSIVHEGRDLHEDFVEEFDRKREKRKLILEEKRKEIQDMREELKILREENDRLRNNPTQVTDNCNNEQIEFLQRRNQNLKEEIESMKQREEHTNILLDKNKELRISVSEMQSELQKLNSCVLDFEQQKEDYKRHVSALKDVIKVSKELLLIRENELKQLKEKMKSIESAFNEREACLMSDDLRREYERQLANIRNLRDLYEERSRTYRRETALLRSSIAEKDKEIEEGAQRASELQERINQLETDKSDKYDTIKSLESNLGLAKAESRQYRSELAVINQLFSHILLAFNNSPDLDLDKLLKQLEEHHGLLKDIVTNEICSEVSSALPKVLLDLVNQISHAPEQEEQLSSDESNDNKKLPAIPEENESAFSTLHNLNSPAEIAENLPKVWRVLIELLSHQSANTSDHDSSEEEDENRCFKTVVTPKGPSLVLSVSKTFFRLKELIVEKKSLEKDMSNLKQLNSHLENRLQDQEKRFEVVSSELSKTWNFVGKLQKEHQLLHTQEKILRYELAQKRKLLKELKEELAYSREKWQEAREKNSKTEKEWLILRKEFAARKKTITTEDGNNSVESGYSDDREGSSDEEPGYETDISECNLKVDENCEDDIAVSSEIENPETTQDDLSANNEENCIVREQIISEDMSDSNENHKGSGIADSSILNVIQNEITVIANELPIETTICNEETSNFPVVQTECEKTETNNELKTNQKNSGEEPSCSSTKPTQTLEERLAARDERLKRLEGQCKALVSQVTNTSNRSVAICNKLEGLHEIYGDSSRSAEDRQSTAVDHNSGETEETHRTDEESQT